MSYLLNFASHLQLESRLNTDGKDPAKKVRDI